jgi:hypothetical protein
MIIWSITNVKWSKDHLTNEDIIKSVGWIAKKDGSNSSQSNVIELNVKLNIDNEVVVNNDMLLAWLFEALGSEKQTIEDSLQ